MNSPIPLERNLCAALHVAQAALTGPPRMLPDHDAWPVSLHCWHPIKNSGLWLRSRSCHLGRTSRGKPELPNRRPHSVIGMLQSPERKDVYQDVCPEHSGVPRSSLQCRRSSVRYFKLLQLHSTGAVSHPVASGLNQNSPPRAEGFVRSNNSIMQQRTADSCRGKLGSCRMRIKKGPTTHLSWLS